MAKLIAGDVLPAGDRLPSIRQTCRSQGISPVTVTQAYYLLESLLESRGLVDGSGEQSNSPPTSSRSPHQ
jgi:DNA-binding transcriptional regulator YhcF (GntR family)